MENKQEVMDDLMRAVEKAGSQTALAREWGVSLQYLNDVIRGNRNISDRILDNLGYKLVAVKKQD